MKLYYNSKICAVHFHPNDITTTWESGVGLSKYSVSVFCLLIFKRYLLVIRKYIFRLCFIYICIQFQICLKKSKLKYGAIPTQMSNITPSSINLITHKNKLQHAHTYYKLIHFPDENKEIDNVFPLIKKKLVVFILFKIYIY